MRALTCAGYEYMKLMVAELQRQLTEIERSKGKRFLFGQYIQHFISFVRVFFLSMWCYLQIKQVIPLNQHLSHHLDDKIHVRILLIDQHRYHLFMLPRQKILKVQIKKRILDLQICLIIVRENNHLSHVNVYLFFSLMLCRLCACMPFPITRKL